MTDYELKKRKQPFNMNPSLSFEWRIKKRQILRASYLYNYENVNIADNYSHYILTSFNSLNKGTGELNQLGSSLALLNYQLGNWSDEFFANIMVLYKRRPCYYFLNSTLTSDYSLSEKAIAKNQHNLNLSATVDKFLNPISTNLKLIFSADKSNSQSKINNEDLRKIKVFNYNYGVELRSSFHSLFNFHVGTKWSTSCIKSTYIKSVTNNKTFLDISFVFNNSFNISFTSELYKLNNIGSNKIYSFHDFVARYVVKKNKLSFLLSANNLTNTRMFTSYLVNDFYSMETRYKLVPTLILLKAEYRF
nr:hypothetical protein [uncultured Bacteroides sp.]